MASLHFSGLRANTVNTQSLRCVTNSSRNVTLAIPQFETDFFFYENLDIDC